jgi:integrase/recombinase XerD
MNDQVIFQSILSHIFSSYIKEKRALGFRFKKAESMLKRFDAFLQTHQHSEISLPKDLVIEWCKQSPNETASIRRHRISLLRGLAEYMNRIGCLAYTFPRGIVTIDRYAFQPYIFSDEEIRRMLIVCDNYPPSAASPYRHKNIPLIIRVLYGCGLRVSEVVGLKKDDIDLTDGTLFIQHTKFNKQRLIPMADSLVQRCREYYVDVVMATPDNEFFFPSPYGGRLGTKIVYDWFRNILWKAGISHTGKGPRLHDLRHVYAVTCLKNWVRKGRDLTNCLAYLSVYLGHEDIRGSQRYLRLTSELYPDIVRTIESNCDWMIPEVNQDETD